MSPPTDAIDGGFHIVISNLQANGLATNLSKSKWRVSVIFSSLELSQLSCSSLSEFTTADVKHYDKLFGLTHMYFLMLLEVRGPQWVSLGQRSKVSSSFLLFWRFLGGISFLAFTSSYGYPHCLACGHLPPSNPVTADQMFLTSHHFTDILLFSSHVTVLVITLGPPT